MAEEDVFVKRTSLAVPKDLWERAKALVPKDASMNDFIVESIRIRVEMDEGISKKEGQS